MRSSRRQQCQSMPLRCQLGKRWEPQGHGIARVCLPDARLGSFCITQGHDIARLCHPDTRLRNFWEGQGHDIARVWFKDARLENLWEDKANSVVRACLHPPGWPLVGKLDARMYTYQNVPPRCQVGTQCHKFAGACPRDASFGNF